MFVCYELLTPNPKAIERATTTRCVMRLPPAMLYTYRCERQYPVGALTCTSHSVVILLILVQKSIDVIVIFILNEIRGLSHYSSSSR